MVDGHSLGRTAESLAELFLTENGCEILARRYRRPGGEIDLVARCDGLLLFVEVKGRRPSRCGRSVEQVSVPQLRRLRRMAAVFLADHAELRFLNPRFDVIAVDFGGLGRGCLLRHLTGVF